MCLTSVAAGVVAAAPGACVGAAEPCLRARGDEGPPCPVAAGLVSEDVGVGFSGTSGWIPSIASQCADGAVKFNVNLNER